MRCIVKVDKVNCEGYFYMVGLRVNNKIDKNWGNSLGDLSPYINGNYPRTLEKRLDIIEKRLDKAGAKKIDKWKVLQIITVLGALGELVVAIFAILNYLK